MLSELLKCKQLFCRNFTSFEYVAPQLKSSSRAVFLNIYRSLKYFTHVFDDPVELLSLTCTDFDSVFIVGDFNIHDEKPEDRGTKELRCVLNNFGLSR